MLKEMDEARKVINEYKQKIDKLEAQKQKLKETIKKQELERKILKRKQWVSGCVIVVSGTKVNITPFAFSNSVIGAWKRPYIYVVSVPPIVLKYVKHDTGRMDIVKFVKILPMDPIAIHNALIFSNSYFFFLLSLVYSIIMIF